MNIISFSLWGSNAKYCNGAIANAKIAKDLYPFWKVIFFTDNILTFTCDQLRAEGAIVTRFPFEGIGRYYWRHCIPDVFWDGVERYLVRDCDSRLNKRGREAVDAWIDSGRTYHFMRDHPRQSVPWMQGMYGVKGYAMRGITQKVRYMPDEFGGGISFFSEMYRQMAPADRLAHGEFYMEHYPDQVPFPSPRSDKRFVGEIFEENGEPNDDWKELP